MELSGNVSDEEDLEFLGKGNILKTKPSIKGIDLVEAICARDLLDRQEDVPPLLQHQDIQWSIT